MKFNKILVAVATASVASIATAEVIPAGTAILAGLDTNEGTGPLIAQAVSAVAVVTDCNTRNALQHMQDMSSCIGKNSKLCAPRIAEAELRAMLTGSVAATTAISGSTGTLASSITSTAGTAGCAAPVIGANTGIQFRHAAGTNDAVDQFLGAPVTIPPSGTLIVGAGSAKTTAERSGDADCISNVTANGRVRFCTVHATSLSDSNNAGFVKVNGAAPDLVNLMSSNYPLVSNLYGTITAAHSATFCAHSTTLGIYVGVGVDGMDGDGVAYHNTNGSAFASANLSPRGDIPDLDSIGKGNCN